MPRSGINNLLDDFDFDLILIYFWFGFDLIWGEVDFEFDFKFAICNFIYFCILIFSWRGFAFSITMIYEHKVVTSDEENMVINF